MQNLFKTYRHGALLSGIHLTSARSVYGNVSIIPPTTINVTTGINSTKFPTTFVTPFLWNNQVRYGGKHLPRYLKGKRGWRKIVERKLVEKRKSRRIGMNITAMKTRAPREKKWTPQTTVEQLYVKYMEEIKDTRKRHSSAPVDEMLDAVTSEMDLQYAMRVWRILSYRNIKFKPHTTFKLVSRFAELGDLDSVFDILMNSKILVMPVDEKTAMWAIDQFIVGNMADKAVQIFERVAGRKYPHFNVKAEHFDKIIDSLASVVEGDHNEDYIKIVFPLTKWKGKEDKKEAVNLLANLSSKSKSALVDACKAVKNEQSPLVTKYLHLALLTDNE